MYTNYDNFMNIFNIPEPYFTLIKLILMSFILSSAANLAKYIYYKL